MLKSLFRTSVQIRGIRRYAFGQRSNSKVLVVRSAERGGRSPVTSINLGRISYQSESCRPMMTALKLCGNSLLANARVSAAVSPLITRPRFRPLVVSAAKAAGPPTIRQQDFIEKLANEAQIPQKDAKACLKAVLDLITDEVSSGNKVSFTGFGTFQPRERAARKGRNPQTQEIMDLPASKTPAFSASKTFKDKVNGNGKA